MLGRVDSFLINQIFQPVVDWTRLKPRDLGRQCAILFFVSCLVKFLVYDSIEKSGVWLWFFLVSFSLLSLVMYVLSGSDSGFVSQSRAIVIRFMFLVFLILSLILMILAPSGKTLIELVADISVTSYYFFACCRYPKPPEKKIGKLVLE